MGKNFHDFIDLYHLLLLFLSFQREGFFHLLEAFLKVEKCPFLISGSFGRLVMGPDIFTLRQEQGFRGTPGFRANRRSPRLGADHGIISNFNMARHTHLSGQGEFLPIFVEPAMPT